MIFTLWPLGHKVRPRSLPLLCFPLEALHRLRADQRKLRCVQLPTMQIHIQRFRFDAGQTLSATPATSMSNGAIGKTAAQKEQYRIRELPLFTSRPWVHCTRPPTKKKTATADGTTKRQPQRPGTIHRFTLERNSSRLPLRLRQSRPFPAAAIPSIFPRARELRSEVVRRISAIFPSLFA